MSTYAQIPFDDISLIENSQIRCPCLLLLDTSGSMTGAPIDELNSGLVTLQQELVSDSLASKRVEVSIVTFGPVRSMCDFLTVDKFIPPSLTATGGTPTGQAIMFGIKKVRERVMQYQQSGVPSYRPWIFLITDGSPTDDWTQGAAEVHRGVGKEFEFFGIGVQGADMNTLGKITPNTKHLQGLSFSELFRWISQSMKAVSRSVAGDQVKLPATSIWESVRS